jgi:hypothetical protein
VTRENWTRRVVGRRVLCDTGGAGSGNPVAERVDQVPLSEDEQRILQQIEQQFYATDPDLAGEIGNHSLYAHCLRRMRWATALFVVGLVVLVVALATAVNFVVSFGGFVVMLGAALWFERSLRKMGRAGMAQLSASLHTGGLRDYFGDTGDRVRNRLRPQDDDSEDDNDRNDRS